MELKITKVAKLRMTKDNLVKQMKLPQEPDPLLLRLVPETVMHLVKLLHKAFGDLIMLNNVIEMLQ